MLKPVNDKVLLKKVEVEEKTKSGLVITSDNKTATQIFEVVDKGNGNLPDGTTVDMSVVSDGDKVILSSYVKCFAYEGTEYAIVKVADIVAIVE